jgi:peptidoglycan/LPS O-acetylase OafA/YrhL
MVIVGLGIIVVSSEFGLYPPAKHIAEALVSAQLLAYVLRSQAAANFLHHPWLVLIGDVSYSLYAFGQITLILVAYTMFTFLPSNTWNDHPTAFSLCLIGLNIALALPVAIASYRWIELPGMAFAKLIINRHAEVMPHVQKLIKSA